MNYQELTESILKQIADTDKDWVTTLVFVDGEEVKEQVGTINLLIANAIISYLDEKGLIGSKHDNWVDPEIKSIVIERHGARIVFHVER